MAVPLAQLTRRELLNVASFSFIPVGELVLSVTIARQLWPAMSVMVVANSLVPEILAYQHPDVEHLELTREFSKDSFVVPYDAGGYIDDEESFLKKVMYKGETAKTSSYFKYLELGATGIPTIGATGFSPFVNATDYLEGLAVIETRLKTGIISERMFIWARLRLDGGTKTDPKTRKIMFTVEKRPSSLNNATVVA